MTGDLLIELGCEELPTWAVRLVLDHLREEIPKLFESSALRFSNLQIFGTPRRVVLVADDVPARQEDRTEVLTGPPKSAGFDAAGQPTKAALGFAAKCGVDVSALQVTRTPKGEYLSYSRVVPGRSTDEILAASLPAILARIQFRKPMYWTESRYTFIRPIRWILALLGTSRMAIQVADVGSGGTTQGHRMLGARDIPVDSRAQYMEALEANHVVLDPARRRSLIAAQLEEMARSLGGKVHPDDELLDEVSYLNEYPQVIAGSIAQEFLRLPAEVLMTVMRKHQKYFTLEDAEGRILPHFLAVMDMAEDRLGVIRKGHERVLRARLNDAAFYWKVDTDKPLESRLPALGRYQFHLKLGSYLEKTERLQSLSQDILKLLGREDLSDDARRACLLSKADLATEMVKEFTELQGIMGGLYAQQEGLPEPVWQAIYDHYRPVNLQEASPRGLLGAVLSLADRADTLAGCFGIGMAPKGSSDPFALRRHAQGLIKILWDHGLELKLPDLLRPAFALVSDRMTLTLDDAARELMSFLERRLRFMLQQREIPYDVVNAAVAVGFERPVDLLARAEALRKIRTEPDFEALAAAFKRVKNILGEALTATSMPISEDHFVEEGELQLFAALQRVGPEAERLAASGAYYDALKCSATLRPAVDLFFEKVLVMAPDPALRANRLALLWRLAVVFLRVADISEIVVAGTAA